MWALKTFKAVYIDEKEYTDPKRIEVLSVLNRGKERRVSTVLDGRKLGQFMPRNHRVFVEGQILLSFEGGDHPVAGTRANLHCADVVPELDMSQIDFYDNNRALLLLLKGYIKRRGNFYSDHTDLLNLKGEAREILMLQAKEYLKPYTNFLSFLGKKNAMDAVFKNHKVSELLDNPYACTDLPIPSADLLYKIHARPENQMEMRHMALVCLKLRTNEGLRPVVTVSSVVADLKSCSLDVFLTVFPYTRFGDYIVRTAFHMASAAVLGRMKELMSVPRQRFHIDLTSLSQDKIDALESMDTRFNILVGEAGTGKTLAITRIAQGAQNAGYQVVCLASTGAAVRTLRKATFAVNLDIDCLTIHTFIGLYTALSEGDDDGGDDSPNLFVIIDEAFMAGAVLLRMLFDKLPKETNFVAVGDPLQLDPVKDFPLLATLVVTYLDIDLADTDTFAPPPSWLKVARLTQNHRTNTEDIISACHAVRDGESWGSPRSALVLPNRSFKDHSLDHLPKLSGEALLTFPEKYLYMSPINRNVDKMNSLLRDAVNPETGNTMFGKQMRLGDLVILKKNVKITQGNFYQKTTNLHEKRLVAATVGDERFCGFGAPDILRKTQDELRLYNSQLAVIVLAKFRNDPVTPALLFEEGVLVRFVKSVYDDNNDEDDEDGLLIKSYDAIPDNLMTVAYARSVHRAQGSQATDVVIDADCAFHHCRLLYTAISRTKLRFKIFENGRQWVNRCVEERMCLPVDYVNLLSITG